MFLRQCGVYDVLEHFYKQYHIIKKQYSSRTKYFAKLSLINMIDKIQCGTDAKTDKLSVYINVSK